MNKKTSKELWQNVSRMGAFRDVGFSANGLQYCGPSITAMYKPETTKSSAIENSQSTTKSTYTNDYCPLECRDQCEKIAEPPANKKWNITHCLCKCGKKTYKPDDPRVLNYRISEYKDNISRIGNIIEKSKLHDHRKCKGKCTHMYILN